MWRQKPRLVQRVGDESDVHSSRVFSLFTQAVNAQTVDERLLRGQTLHNTICRGCHEDDMYTKRHLSRNPYFDLRMQTRLWSEVVKVKWSDAEIDDVVYYLHNTYYKH